MTSLDMHESAVTHCLFSPNGQLFISATTSGALYIWSPSNNFANVKVVQAHGISILDVKFSQNSSYLATCGGEGRLRVWDVDSGFTTNRSYYGPINKLGFVAEKQMVIGEATGHIRYLNIDA